MVSRRVWCGAAAVVAAALSVSGCTSGSTTASSAQPSASPAPRTLLKASGSGPDTTQPFEAPAGWDVRYTYDCAATDGDFKIFVERFGRVLNILADVPDRPRAVGKGTTRWPHGGTYTLKVDTHCAWTLEASS